MWFDREPRGEARGDLRCVAGHQIGGSPGSTGSPCACAPARFSLCAAIWRQCCLNWITHHSPPGWLLPPRRPARGRAWSGYEAAGRMSLSPWSESEIAPSNKNAASLPCSARELASSTLYEEGKKPAVVYILNSFHSGIVENYFTFTSPRSTPPLHPWYRKSHCTKIIRIIHLCTI